MVLESCVGNLVDVGSGVVGYMFGLVGVGDGVGYCWLVEYEFE